MIISVTERQSFKRCRRKWDYSSVNRQSLQPVINAPALELGTLVHATLAEWTANLALDPCEVYEDLATKSVQRIVADYEQRVGCKPSEQELDGILKAFALGMFMIKNYRDFWKSPLPPGFSLIENEQTITIDIPGSFDSKGNQNKLEGTLDGLVADTAGQLFVLERKTFSRHPGLQELDNNDQFLAYVWAVQQLDIGIVRGVAYDGLWKRQTPPAGKTMADMFLRRNLMRPRAEIEEFGDLLRLELDDMAAENVRIYKNVSPLGGCWDCNYNRLCVASSRQDTNLSTIQSEYIKTTNKHWREEVE